MFLQPGCKICKMQESIESIFKKFRLLDQVENGLHSDHLDEDLLNFYHLLTDVDGVETQVILVL